MTFATRETGMRYEIRFGETSFANLTPEAALIKMRELIAEEVEDIYLYDDFGDPMGLSQLEQIVASAT